MGFNVPKFLFLTSRKENDVFPHGVPEVYGGFSNLN